MPGTLRADSSSRAMIAGARSRRSLWGRRLISIRPLLSVVLAPSTPMNEDRLTTAGSARIRSASACCRSDIAAKETVCGASVTACNTALSCTGKKPFGAVT